MSHNITNNNNNTQVCEHISGDTEVSANESISDNDNIRRENIIGAPKRLREASQSSFLLENIMKTPRLSNNDSPFKLLNLVDKRFENMQSLLQTMFQESEARLEKMFDAKLNDLKRDMQSINQRVTKLETVVEDVNSLKDEIIVLKTKLQRQENSLAAADLRINGIPYHKDENLLSVFDSICNTLRINTPVVKSIFRLRNQGNKEKSFSPDAVIIVKLNSAYDKNYILRTLANFRKVNKSNLLLDYIGYGSNAPFYINENLTSTNHKILKSTINLRKSRKIFATFTMRGLVYIKINENDKPVCIHFIDDLKNFFRDEQNNQI